MCLSFAGANRDYVDEVASELHRLGVSCFYDYDGPTEVALWGKDLYQHLHDVYRRGRCCVVFVSEAYVRSRWAAHELRAAQATAFLQQREYILPARFDDTELPGVPHTTGYIDLRRRGPADLAVLIAEKVGQLGADAPDVADPAGSADADGPAGSSDTAGLTGSDGSARPGRSASVTARARRRRVAGIIAAAVALVAVVAVVIYVGNRPAESGDPGAAGPSGTTSVALVSSTAAAPPGSAAPQTANASGGANTFADPRKLLGTGPDVPYRTVLQVECKILAPSAQSVRYWYRIAGPEQWRGLYTPANSYLNGDPVDGPYEREVDHSVPDCP